MRAQLARQMLAHARLYLLHDRRLLDVRTNDREWAAYDILGVCKIQLEDQYGMKHRHKCDNCDVYEEPPKPRRYIRAKEGKNDGSLGLSLRLR